MCAWSASLELQALPGQVRVLSAKRGSTRGRQRVCVIPATRVNIRSLVLGTVLSVQLGLSQKSPVQTASHVPGDGFPGLGLGNVRPAPPVYMLPTKAKRRATNVERGVSLSNGRHFAQVVRQGVSPELANRAVRYAPPGRSPRSTVKACAECALGGRSQISTRHGAAYVLQGHFPPHPDYRSVKYALPVNSRRRGPWNALIALKEHLRVSVKQTVPLAYLGRMPGPPLRQCVLIAPLGRFQGPWHPRAAPAPLDSTLTQVLPLGAWSVTQGHGLRWRKRQCVSSAPAEHSRRPEGRHRTAHANYVQMGRILRG